MPRTPRTKTCQRCKGQGGYFTKLRNLGSRDFDEHYVQCQQLECNNGTVNVDAYYESWNFPKG